MDDKIKYVLLAVGAYFLYDWYTKQNTAAAALPGATATPLPAGTVVAPVTAAPAAPIPAVAATPTLSANISVLSLMTNDQIAAFAAQGNADAVTLANQRGLRYSHHQWNYFRSLALGAQPDPELWAPGASTAAVTASEYLAMRVAAGMGGMSGLGWAPILPFSTAWSA